MGDQAGAIAPDLLIGPGLRDFSQFIAAGNGNSLAVYLHLPPGPVQVGGGFAGSQVINTLAVPQDFQRFTSDVVLNLNREIGLDLWQTSDRSRADIEIFFDSTIDLDDDGLTLGLAASNLNTAGSPSGSKIRWWEIFLNAPELIDNPTLLHYALIHELGHALGLEHPFDDDDGDVYLSANWQASATPEQTVMSYRTPSGGNSAWPTWYSANDLAALKTIWGDGRAALADTTAPVLLDALVTGNTLVLRFDEALADANLSPRSFKLRADGRRLTPLTVRLDGDERLVEIGLPAKAGAVERLNWSYKASRRLEPIRDLSGNPFVAQGWLTALRPPISNVAPALSVQPLLISKDLSTIDRLPGVPMAKPSKDFSKGRGGQASPTQVYMRFDASSGTDGSLGGFRSSSELVPRGTDTPIGGNSPPGLVRELRDESNGLIFQLLSRDLRPGVVDAINVYKLSADEPESGELWYRYFTDDPESPGFPIKAMDAVIAKGDLAAFQAFLLNAIELLIEGSDSSDVLDFPYKGTAFIAGGAGTNAVASAIGTRDNILTSGGNDNAPSYFLVRGIGDTMQGWYGADTYSVFQGSESKIESLSLGLPFEEDDRIVLRLDTVNAGKSAQKKRRSKGGGSLNLSDFSADPLISGGYLFSAGQIAIEGVDPITASTRVIFDSNEGKLYFDVDGSGKALPNLFTTLIGGYDFTAGILADALRGYAGSSDPYYAKFVNDLA